MAQFDYIVVGGGIAGASAAYELAAFASVLLLEREDRCGYHSTGRSAALYVETYGNPTVRALTTAGKAFYRNPPQGFTDHALLHPRGVMLIGRPDQQASLDAALAEVSGMHCNIRPISADEAYRRSPVLKPGYVGGAVLDPDCMDIDVNALHQGYLRGLKARGGELRTDAAVQGLERQNGSWTATTKAGAFQGSVIVDAAGAWGDEMAALAGVNPVGITPKRRSAILFQPPAGVDTRNWHSVVDVDEQFYFKPDAGRIMASPADETPMPPCDVQPEELDIAILIDRLEQAADLPVRRIENRWAGLRSFASDKTPVVGYDPKAEGFFWLVGQGGYGIQTAPGISRLVASLARGKGVPADIAELGVSEQALSPARFDASRRAGG
jgi:D-arginine dehydrogenase